MSKCEVSKKTKPKIWIKSLGCKANFSDGQALEHQLSNLGYEPVMTEVEADLIVVNSCTVTNEADVQSRKAAKDAAKKNQVAKVVYTGCGAEVNPEASLKIQGVGAVLGNQDKNRAAQLIHEYFQKNALPNEFSEAVLLGGVRNYAEFKSQHPHDREWPIDFDSDVEPVMVQGTESPNARTRAFLKIQEGCDSFCTYCIIPYGRGKSRSLAVKTLVSKVQSLVEQGTQEVVLTGTNLGDYRHEAEGTVSVLDDLIESILDQTHLKRLRVGSLDPLEITPRIVELMEKYEAFCPHFHVSLQHVDSKVLKLMKRKYSFEDVEKCLNLLSSMKRKPFVGMDYIVGFPGESEQVFEESLEKLANLYWSRLHVFPYSERAGTPATRILGKVDFSIRKKRAKILQEMSLKRMSEIAAQMRKKFDNSSGSLRGVLIEGHVKGPDGTRNWFGGYSPEYDRVFVSSSVGALPNTIQTVAVKNWVLDRVNGDVIWIAEGLQ